VSYTTILKTDGLSVIASNTVLDAGGSPHVVSNDILDTGAANYTVFGGTVSLSPLNVVKFNLFDNRIFDIMDVMRTEKRLTDEVFVQINMTKEFALWDPVDQISTVAWAVESGDVTLSNDSIKGTDKCLVKVSGGTKLYSWHAIRATITCASGQVYTPLVEIQLIR
jgi:hypothetical protein